MVDRVIEPFAPTLFVIIVGRVRIAGTQEMILTTYRATGVSLNLPETTRGTPMGDGAKFHFFLY